MMNDLKLQKFYIGLSPRKRQVLELASQGLSSKEIAKRLCIVESSLAGHLSSIYAEMETLEELTHLKPTRLLLISIFAPFFDRHPDLRNYFSVGS